MAQTSVLISDISFFYKSMCSSSNNVLYRCCCRTVLFAMFHCRSQWLIPGRRISSSHQCFKSSVSFSNFHFPAFQLNANSNGKASQSWWRELLHFLHESFKLFNETLSVHCILLIWSSWWCGISSFFGLERRMLAFCIFLSRLKCLQCWKTFFSDET